MAKKDSACDQRACCGFRLALQWCDRAASEWQRRIGKVGSEVTEISKSADFEIMAKLLLSRLRD